MFPSYSSGSVKTQALQAEVDKMLQKGILKIISPPGLGYYSCLFLLQKATGRWRLVIDLLALNHDLTHTLFKMMM